MVEIDSLSDLLCNIKEAMKTHFFTKQEIQDNYSPIGHSHTVDNELDSDSTNPVQNKVVKSALDDKADIDHTHTIPQVTGLRSELDDKSDADHNHDSRYYTESEMDGKLSNKSDSDHIHTIANVTDLQRSLDNKADESHTHDGRYFTESEVTGKLATKSDTGHNHDSSYVQISDFNTLDSKFNHRSAVRVRLIRANNNFVPYSQDDELDNEGTRLQVFVGDKLGVQLYTSDPSISLANRSVRVILGNTSRELITNNKGLTTDMIGLNNGQNGLAYAILKGTTEFYKDFDIKYIEY